jgi:hypothetical protein
MKNQNSNSKLIASFSAKQMDNEYNQQTEKFNSNEITTTISSSSTTLNEKVN